MLYDAMHSIESMGIDIQSIIKMLYDFLIGVVQIETETIPQFFSVCSITLDPFRIDSPKTVVHQESNINNEISHSITAIANLFGRQFN